MKKILFGLFFFCILGVSKGFAVELGTYNFGESGTLEVTSGSINYVNGGNIRNCTISGVDMETEIDSIIFSDFVTTIRYLGQHVYYCDSSMYFAFFQSGLSSVANIWNPSTGYIHGLTFRNPSNGNFILVSNNPGPNTFLESSILPGPVIYSPNVLLTSGPQLECTTINQPSTGLQSLNTGPYENITASGTESKYFETGTGNFIGFINLNIEESDILDFLENDTPLNFSTKGLPYIFEAISTPTIYFGSDKGIDTINLSDSNIGPIEALFLDKSGNVTNTQEYTNISEISFPKTDALLVRFGKSFSERILESFDFKSESPSIIEKQLCLNPETGDYTLDGEEYTGNTGSLSEIEDVPVNEWTFSTSGYQFYENGFCLANFVPSPYGGKLFFEIVNPLGENLTTGFLLPYDIKGRVQGQEPGNGYGFDSCPKITTFYHEEPGNYKVRVKYEYNGKSIYPFGNDYNSYTITLPERAGAGVNVWETESCGADTEGALFLPGVSKFFSCLSETISNFFKDQYEAIKKVGSLLYKISDIFTTDVEKPLSYIKSIFVLQSYADNSYINVYSEPEGFSETIWGKSYFYIKSVLYIIVLVFFLAIIIFIKTRND